MKIYHWNAGSMHWKRKREDIEALIFERDPDILVISEANLMKETSEEERYVQGYEMILPPTMTTLGYARVVMLIKEGINYKILDKCMNENISCIYIQLGFRGRKPLNVGGIYREQHLLKQPEVDTARPNLQLARWRLILAGWKAVAAQKYQLCDYRRHESGLWTVGQPRIPCKLGGDYEG